MNNLSDIINYIINEVSTLFLAESVIKDENGNEQIVSQGVKLSEFELDKLTKIFNFTYQSVPGSKLALTDLIQNGISIKSDINYFILKIKEKKRNYSINFIAEYNKLFTVLTRRGLPSKAAIDSEIFYTYPRLNEQKVVIDRLESLIELFTQQSSLIDTMIRSLESRRYELSL